MIEYYLLLARPHGSTEVKPLLVSFADRLPIAQGYELATGAAIREVSAEFAELMFVSNGVVEAHHEFPDPAIARRVAEETLQKEALSIRDAAAAAARRVTEAESAATAAAERVASLSQPQREFLQAHDEAARIEAERRREAEAEAAAERERLAADRRGHDDEAKRAVAAAGELALELASQAARDLPIAKPEPAPVPPVDLTAPPATTASAPATTASAPATTTSAPATTTSAPATTTSAPAATTSAPAAKGKKDSQPGPPKAFDD